MTEKEIELCNKKDRIETVLLRRCPICGGVPTIRFEKSGTDLYGVEIACHNEECTLRIEAYGGNVEKAAARWNTRTDEDYRLEEFVKTEKGWLLSEHNKFRGGEEKGLFE